MAQSAIIFKDLVKHGRLALAPGVPTAFEDEDAAPYFIAAGWADKTDKEAVVVYPLGLVDIDPETTFTNGELVVKNVVSKPKGS